MELGQGAALERQCTGQHDIEAHAHAPDVNLAACKRTRVCITMPDQLLESYRALPLLYITTPKTGKAGPKGKTIGRNAKRPLLAGHLPLWLTLHMIVILTKSPSFLREESNKSHGSYRRGGCQGARGLRSKGCRTACAAGRPCRCSCTGQSR